MPQKSAWRESVPRLLFWLGFLCMPAQPLERHRRISLQCPGRLKPKLPSARVAMKQPARAARKDNEHQEKIDSKDGSVQLKLLRQPCKRRSRQRKADTLLRWEWTTPPPPGPFSPRRLTEDRNPRPESENSWLLTLPRSSGFTQRCCCCAWAACGCCPGWRRGASFRCARA